MEKYLVKNGHFWLHFAVAPKCMGCICQTFSPMYVFKCVLKSLAPGGDKVKSKWVLKLPARERMQSHIACITFSVVYFQIFLQIACFRWRIVALVAFVWLFPVCIFEWVLKLLAWEEAESHWFKLSPNWLHLFDFFDISSCFLQNFYICINILKSSFHCQCVFCFAQMIGSNWIKKHDWLLNSNNPNFS